MDSRIFRCRNCRQKVSLRSDAEIEFDSIKCPRCFEFGFDEISSSTSPSTSGTSNTSSTQGRDTSKMIIAASAAFLVITVGIAALVVFTRGSKEEPAPLSQEPVARKHAPTITDEPKVPKPPEDLTKDSPVTPKDPNKWSITRILFQHPGDRVLVGLNYDSDGPLDANSQFLIVGKANGDDIQPALAQVSANVPLIIDEPQLTSELSKLPYDESIPQSLVKRIIEFAKSRLFLEEEMDFVTFRRATDRVWQLGLFVTADANSLTYRSINNLKITIAKDNIIPGTAFRASGDRILDGLNEDLFFDYCVFHVAKELSQQEAEKTEKLDFRNRRKLLLFPRYITPEIQEPISPYLAEVPNMEFEGKGQFGVLMSGLAPMMMTAYVTSSNNQRLREYEQRLQNAKDRRTSLELRKQTLSEMMEVFAGKIDKFGVPVLSSDFVMEMGKDRQHDFFNNLNKDPDKTLDELGATHVLVFDFTNPKSNDAMLLDVELKGKREGITRQLWKSVTPKTLRRTDSYRQWFYTSAGKIVKFYSPDWDEYEIEPAESNVEEAKFWEEKPIFPPERLTGRSNHVAYLEELYEGSSTEPFISIRPLFSNRSVELQYNLKPFNGFVPENAEEAPIWRYREVNDLGDVPPELKLRFLMSEILDAAIPSAGRVVSFNQETQTARAHFGRALSQRKAFRAGENLIAVRILPDNQKETLPTLLKVSSINEDVATVKIQDNGLQNYWPETALIEVGNLVFVPHRKRIVFSVLKPVRMQIDTGGPLFARINDAAKNPRSVRNVQSYLFGQVQQQARIACTSFAGKITNELEKLGHEVVAVDENPDEYAQNNGLMRRDGTFDEIEVLRGLKDMARARGATHVIAALFYPRTGSVNIAENTASVSAYNVELMVIDASKDFDRGTSTADRQGGHWKFQLNQLDLQ